MIPAVLRFRLSAVLAALAVLLWLLALDGRGRAGRTWLLEDRSASMAGRVAPAEAVAAAGKGLRFRFGAGVAAADAPAPPDHASRLGLALSMLAPRLRAGDRLQIWSDGRATDLLPDPLAYAGVGLDWLRPLALPRIGEIEAPTFLPESGRVQIGVEILDGDPMLGELEVAALAPAELGVPRLLGAGPSASGAQVELELDISVPAGRSIVLRLRWRQGRAIAERSLTLAAAGRFPVWGGGAAHWSTRVPSFEPAESPETARILFAGPGTSRSELDLALRRGAMVVGGNSFLPAGLRPLRPALEPGGAVLVLIDVSGSMAGGPFAEALDRLSVWAAELPPEFLFQVRPFAAELGPTADPRRTQEWAALERRLPFGPTGLAAALTQAATEAVSGAHLVVVSDGRAEAPAAGWEELGQRLAGVYASVRCVPVGPTAERRTLQRIGQLAPEGEDLDLAGRLEQSLSSLSGTVSGPLRPVAGTLWSLPALLELPEPLPRLELRPGAEALLRHAEGSDGAALLRTGAGVVLGLAGSEEDAGWAPLVRSVAAGLSQPRLERRGSWLQLAGDGQGWAARSGHGGLRGFDRYSPGLWRCGPFPTREPVEVQPPVGASLRFPGTPEPEWAAGTRAWTHWLQVQERLPASRSSAPVLLGAALLCAVLALAAGRRRKPAPSAVPSFPGSSRRA